MRLSLPRLLVATLPLLAACGQSSTQQTNSAAAVSAATLLTPGLWHGELAIQGRQLPFLFRVKVQDSKPVVYLINKGLNREEHLRCDSITAAGDSVTIRLHVFDAALVVRADGKDKLKGAWVKYDTKTPYRVPLVAVTGAALPKQEEDAKSLAGTSLLGTGATYSVQFRDEKGTTYPAVGIFKSNNRDSLTGTFLTTTGDYRFLSGRLQVQGDAPHLLLSTFDGNHAFLFDGMAGAREIKGDFYSGKSGHETWTATPDPRAKLPNADTLTYLKKGESRLKFKFPSVVAGASISPTDAKYRGKVVVLQVLGSWCPNCMDETRFLAPWYQQNKQRGVEVIGLGYERSPEYAQAAERLRAMKKGLNVGYDVAVAGVSNKDSVAKSMPQLAKFLAFPTTIFLDKKGVVRSIHTGFSGPGTGKYYEEEKAHFNRTVDKLLRE